MERKGQQTPGPSPGRSFSYFSTTNSPALSTIPVQPLKSSSFVSLVSKKPTKSEILASCEMVHYSCKPLNPIEFMQIVQNSSDVNSKIPVTIEQDSSFVECCANAVRGFISRIAKRSFP